jgi:hypothetical protein
VGDVYPEPHARKAALSTSIFPTVSPVNDLDSTNSVVMAFYSHAVLVNLLQLDLSDLLHYRVMTHDSQLIQRMVIVTKSHLAYLLTHSPTHLMALSPIL